MAASEAPDRDPYMTGLGELGFKPVRDRTHPCPSRAHRACTCAFMQDSAVTGRFSDTLYRHEEGMLGDAVEYLQRLGPMSSQQLVALGAMYRTHSMDPLLRAGLVVRFQPIYTSAPPGRPPFVWDIAHTPAAQEYLARCGRHVPPQQAVEIPAGPVERRLGVLRTELHLRLQDAGLKQQGFIARDAEGRPGRVLLCGQGPHLLQERAQPRAAVIVIGDDNYRDLARTVARWAARYGGHAEPSPVVFVLVSERGHAGAAVRATCSHLRENYPQLVHALISEYAPRLTIDQQALWSWCRTQVGFVHWTDWFVDPPHGPIELASLPVRTADSPHNLLPLLPPTDVAVDPYEGFFSDDPWTEAPPLPNSGVEATDDR